MSYTDESSKPARNYKLLLALCLVLIFQIGACSYIGGDEFFIMPVFCTAISSSITSGYWTEFLPLAYVVILALNPLVIFAGLAFRKLTPAALIFGSVALLGIALQIAFLSRGILWCDGT